MSVLTRPSETAAVIEMEAAPRPLVVDVDGTLIMSDLLIESGLQFMTQRPAELWRLPGWLSQGKSVLKARLADHVELETGTVPLRPSVLARIHEAQAAGRPVYLASASDRRYVEALADRVGGIAGVFATDATTNLAGHRKASRLVEAFGPGGFDYIGDDPVDLPVWREAGTAIAVARSARFEARVRGAFPDADIVERVRTPLKSYLRALRPHQWVKNTLLFLPLLSGHLINAASIGLAVAGFLCFCAAASSAYIINDLLDLPADREHHRKRSRPFASGSVPLIHGIGIAAALMAAALLGALVLAPLFALVLGGYVAATLAYSFTLKRRLLIDVITLGGLYTVRVLAGVVAVGAKKSPWLLMFCLFLFLSLAIVKRCSELVVKMKEGKLGVSGRNYRVSDLNVLTALAAAAGFAAVLVFSLYIASPDVMPLYSRPYYLFLVCPILMYWVSRIIMISNRGEMHDDPVVFAITDKVSLASGVLCMAIIGLAI